MPDASGLAGLIGSSVRKVVLGDEVWTMSVWRDEASMVRFVSSDVHQAAMHAGADAIEDMRTHTFEVSRGSLPIDWDAALSRLDAEVGTAPE